MNKLAEEILDRIDAWPKEAQAELVQSIVDIEEKHVGLYRLTDDERELVALALALGAGNVGGALSATEEAVAAQCLAKSDGELVTMNRRLIKLGKDPLGDRFCAIRTAATRRQTGSFYTDPPIVEAMLRWVAAQRPDEVIDCGAGSGRFAIGAARLPGVASVVAVEIDPVACLILRARAAVLGIKTINVLNADFLTLKLDPTDRRRAFVGNPPYVRHHTLTTQQKLRGQRIAAGLGLR